MDDKVDSGEALRVLQRMIAYVQSEARRLGAFEAALLLDRAAVALAAFSRPALAADRREGGCRASEH